MAKRIYLSSPHMGGLEFEYVKEAFATNWISPAGPHLTAFENELSQYLGNVHVAALSSGTAAIHLALVILGVGPGDEVISSSFTFSGSCNPIAYQGARPIFVDSEPETWNMDPELLEAAIRDRQDTTGRLPKAIIVVHLYGMPAKMNEIMRIASQYGIPVIEDAAEALGSTYQGQKCGTFGDFGILSFNGNKIITTSGGGALVATRRDWIEKARFLSTQARDPAPHYQHSHIGYNYRLSNVCAGIGLGQMKVLDARVEGRREVFAWYRDRVRTSVDWSFPAELPGFFSNRWLSTALFSQMGTSERLRLAFERENIESRPLWKPMHLQPVFAHEKAFVNGVSERLFQTGICLPSGTNMDPDDLERIEKVLLEFV